MKIAFHSNHLSISGSEVALFDYAYYNQKLLGNESVIVAKNNTIDDDGVVEKFNKNFKTVIRYNDFSEVEKLLDKNNIDIFYAIKSGEYDGIISPGRKTVIHAVFKAFQPHGKVYAYISEWLSKQMNYGLSPWVPHMIDLPEESGNFREQLNIPKDSIVFGRYGSYDTFDISFVHSAIKDILNRKKNVYFLFANTRQFYNHTNIIYLDTIADMNEKVKFINTCDALLHARGRGETFGLACGEFSVKNKPVFTYGLSPEKNHIEILKDKAILYNTESELFKKLDNFIPSPEKNWDAYSEKFNPSAIMQKFKTVFL
jgi:hypothetical protein